MAEASAEGADLSWLLHEQRQAALLAKERRKAAAAAGEQAGPAARLVDSTGG